MALIELETAKQLEEAIETIGDEGRYIILASRAREIYILPTKSTRTLHKIYYKPIDEGEFGSIILSITQKGYKVLYVKRVFFDERQFVWRKE